MGQEATVRTGHGTTDWSKLGKEYKSVYCHPALFKLYSGYIMLNAGLDESQAGIKIVRRNINNLRPSITILMAESEGNLKGS